MSDEYMGRFYEDEIDIDDIIDNINTLEQAIKEICDADTIAKIQTRKQELQKK